MTDNRAILIVDSDAVARNNFEMVVRCLGYAPEIAENRAQALATIDANRAISLVLLDLRMPRLEGLETLRAMRAAGCRQPVIVVSETVTILSVVDAIKSGATNFLAKPVNHHDLILAIQSALKEAPEPEDGLAESWMEEDMQAAWRRVAASDLPLLIEGEIGAGKEALARRIHAHSPRASKPFVKLNCAALPGDLAGREIFGCERGCETAGAILLDGVGDLDIRLQARLAHVLEDRDGRIPFDMRVMAATDCDLRRAVDAGQFRADLYYRLNVVSIRVPPLRERKAEIHPAAVFFLRKHRNGGPSDSLLSPALRHALLEHEWPGNLRELENTMRRLLVMQDPDELARQLLAANIRRAPAIGAIRFQPAGAVSSLPSLEKVNEAKRMAEADAIVRALDASRWNRKRAAQILRIDYKALLYKMRKLEIDRPAEGRRAAASA